MSKEMTLEEKIQKLAEIDSAVAKTQKAAAALHDEVTKEIMDRLLGKEAEEEGTEV